MRPTLFQDLLKEWHLQYGRILPWVDEKNPYKIWISEIILQQTRVEQGLPYYVSLLKPFQIFLLWQMLLRQKYLNIGKVWVITAAQEIYIGVPNISFNSTRVYSLINIVTL